jgi:hypothetical protein
MGFRGQFEEHRRFQIELLKTSTSNPATNFSNLAAVR